MTDQTIIERVDALIEAQGKTARAVAAAADIDPSTLSRARKSKSGELSVESLRRLAPVLGTTVAYLAGETDDPAGARQISTAGDTAVVRLAYNDLKRSPLNPRKHFDDAALRELADSIAAKGLLQNITVRVARDADGRHQIIAGERRWRAIGLLVGAKRWDPAKAAIPVRLLDVDDRGHLELAIIENLQRQDVSALEEAEGLLALRQGGMTTAQIAETIGVTQRYVQQAIALAEKLTDAAKDRLRTGEITKSQARALAALPEPLQDSALKVITDKTTEADVKRLALADCVPMDRAAFTVDPTGPDGARVLTDASGKQWFQGRERFMVRQIAWAKGRAEDLGRTWAWSDFRQSHSIIGGLWDCLDERTEDHAAGGAVVMMDYEGTVTVHVGLVKRAAPEGEDQPTPEEIARDKRVAEAAAFAEELRTVISQDPQIALALWLYDTLDAVPSHLGRVLDHHPYRNGLGAGNCDHPDAPLGHIGHLVTLGPGAHDSHVRWDCGNPARVAWPLLRRTALPQMVDAVVDRIADRISVPSLYWMPRAELHPILRQIAEDAGLTIPDCFLPAQHDLEDAPATPTTAAAE